MKGRALTVSAVLAGLACLLPVARAHAESFSLFGYLAAGGSRVDSQRAWLNGGFGRLVTGARGASGASGTANDGRAEGRLGLRWEIGTSWAIEIHALARAEPESKADAAGLSEAFLTWTHGFAAASELRLRAGLFFLPTSREAVSPLWTSPYTLTLSALNSWIGEEIRPVGIDGALRFGDHLSAGATIFGGNDTAGALLAWRGWSMGDRVSALGEALPLPPLDSLSDPAAFGRQRREGAQAFTQPVGSDLDGKPGWSVRGRFEDGGALMQASSYDNRGDRRLYHGEYAWRTRMTQLASQIEIGDLTLVSEGMLGKSGMGELTQAHVNIDFWAVYGLASVHRGPWRVSLRYDRFYIDDRDHSSAENNDDRGSAWTLAGLWQPADTWRLGLEWLDQRSRRPAAADSGGDANTKGRQWRAEARFTF
ncbi:MAG: porin [Acidobacteriota bacterium]